MKFEVINEKNKVVMHCEHIRCFPTVEEVQVMSKSGYKFKIDGQNINVTKLISLLKENSNNLKE